MSILVSDGAISDAQVLSKMFGSLSGPEALAVFKLISCFWTPLVVMIRVGNLNLCNFK